MQHIAGIMAYFLGQINLQLDAGDRLLKVGGHPPDARRCQLWLIIGDALSPAHRLCLTNSIYFSIFILLFPAHVRGVVMIRVEDQFVSGNRTFTAG